MKEEKEQIITNFIEIFKNETIQDYLKNSFWDFIQALFTGDVFSGISSIKNAKDLFFHIPTVIFWDKMRKFLLGTYRDFEDQIRMANKFSKDNAKYREFVSQLFDVVDKIDCERKIDYFSSLTRSYLSNLIDEDLYYELRKLIMNCTINELQFINDTKQGQRLEYNMMIFFFKGMGLVDLNSDYSSNYYLLTELALKLKEHALNDDSIPKHKALLSETKPPEDMIPATSKETEEMFNINTQS